MWRRPGTQPDIERQPKPHCRLAAPPRSNAVYHVHLLLPEQLHEVCPLRLTQVACSRAATSMQGIALHFAH